MREGSERVSDDDGGFRSSERIPSTDVLHRTDQGTPPRVVILCNIPFLLCAAKLLATVDRSRLRTNVLKEMYCLVMQSRLSYVACRSHLNDRATYIVSSFQFH